MIYGNCGLSGCSWMRNGGLGEEEWAVSGVEISSY